MNKNEARSIARTLGVLKAKKSALEDEIKVLSEELSTYMAKIPPNEKGQHVLDEVDGFTCKLYERVALYASQERAKGVLTDEQFNVVFQPSKSNILDIRMTAAGKAALLGVVK